MLLIIASAATLSAIAPVHSAGDGHATNAGQASYGSVWTVRFQQVEPRFASRPVTAFCRWQAESGSNRGVKTPQHWAVLLSKLDRRHKLCVKGE